MGEGNRTMLHNSYKRAQLKQIYEPINNEINTVAAGEIKILST